MMRLPCCLSRGYTSQGSSVTPLEVPLACLSTMCMSWHMLAPGRVMPLLGTLARQEGDRLEGVLLAKCRWARAKW